MKFYITKHAIAKGIVEIDGDAVSGLQVKNGELSYHDKDRWVVTYSKEEWYTERSLAVLDAERRRDKRIESLRRQLLKLERMKFE